MSELPFAHFCDKFSGQTGWVIGRGPTRFDYAALGQTDGPVFFINDAVSQEKWLAADRPAFFFAHDAAMACWLSDPGVRSIPVLIVDQPLTGPVEDPRPGLIGGPDDPRLANLPRSILYRKDGPLDRATLLNFDRQEIARSGQLHVGGATIHPLLHFAWYVGCAKLVLIGCDGLPETGYDARLENRSKSTQQNALAIRVQQEEILRRLSLPREYLGAIPHRIKMLMELRVSRENHKKILTGVQLLAARFLASGCRDLAVSDWVERAGSCWIEGLWPEVESCVGCLASPSYRQILQQELSPLLGDLRTNPRIAYQAQLES